MIGYLLRRLGYALPIMLGVSFLCFMLVYLAPGDPLVSILPADASAELQKQMMQLYGFDRPLIEQFVRWLWRALQGDLGHSIATSRPVVDEVFKAVGNTLMIAVLATLIGFTLGALFGFVAGYFRNSWGDRLASFVSVIGVSLPNYWLGMVLVIVFSAQLMWLPATGAGPGGSGSWTWDWEHVQYLILPALTMSFIPMGIVARTVRALVADILSQEFVVGLRARGLGEWGVFKHVVKNCAPTALAVMGLQLGYLLGGSILIETVFSWPGTGFLLNQAIFQRDLPLLQGTILVLALFFVALNLLVDVLQTIFDPRIERG
ncbi:ABC transporter permease [Stutzerimonas sp. Brlt_13]|jgi:peptide/nickel transport system permease protein|uniref:ABC transporter permease n=1 Tax=Stutzerimonas stutzeri TaxID=316 RepID=A0AA42P7A7_STUST|nr:MULTISPECIES: ABC transporter permease [Pseudomonadaceae]OHC17853.1 MAG: ABC transporter permease [Pseudomonadales bacterium RIFCSPHIGHO2_01_FULL_64_12]HAV03752.1 ABC transporter permease [Pseudomonas sp.]MBE7373954.1 ABC transporter permease [Pseudomonas lopnurensis]MDH0183948.1 ABC transporter permease [Stutzerimonas stutzeri]MDH1235208.1 ABC transporter permease [Stutzerimonas stutzeri]